MLEIQPRVIVMASTWVQSLKALTSEYFSRELANALYSGSVIILCPGAIGGDNRLLSITEKHGMKTARMHLIPGLPMATSAGGITRRLRFSKSMHLTYV